MSWVLFAFQLAKAAFELWKWVKSQKDKPAALEEFKRAHKRLVLSPTPGTAPDIVRE